MKRPQRFAIEVTLLVTLAILVFRPGDAVAALGRFGLRLLMLVFLRA